MLANPTVRPAGTSPGRGGRRPGAGRKLGSGRGPTYDSRTLYLDPTQREYLRLWGVVEGMRGEQLGNESEGARSLVERMTLLWPYGPSSNPRSPETVLERAAENRPLDRPEPSEQGSLYAGLTLSLTPAHWAYCDLWSGINFSVGFRALVERARKWWPRGPYTNPRMDARLLAWYEGASPTPQRPPRVVRLPLR